MQRLRTSTRLIRLMMAWFALALGVAVLAPVLHPQAMELVCTTSGGMKLVVLGEDADAAPAAHAALKCPACLAVLPPPAHATPWVPHLPAPSHATGPVADTPLAVSAGAPLPPRGPPAQA